ncbi:hypothetical protein WICPIJ_000334 [Wickerhamomyces pijperi]|uniref:Ubiquitin carboxyl-terminal hydrolase n=1 Tax=Wickerhamomyces pijperi TaxID=599730 RepID=A0A9P8QDS3_WICPI|nr:hypothetical protein WICPIJ_000334 [Wickerhamomyces pijperi]
MSFNYDGGAIAKDECFFCFEDQFGPSGLFISPSSKKAYCLTHLKSHFSHHPEDKIYLNLRKTRKEPKQKDVKIIKLEIKQQLDSDLYDVHQQLLSYNGESISPIENIDEATQANITRVVNSSSSETANDIKAWQQEFNQCEHTIEFQQQPIENIDLTKCGACELKENLWICLTCGTLGCGRAQFGGVPGNTHALSHYQESGHPIAVKLGSLSKDVMDVYCYQCDDEIVFPRAPALLKTYGIDVSSFVKTEKSLVELQIEQNVNWDFNLKNDKGEDLPAVFGQGLTGLKNLGNSCYLASVVQTLFSMDEYRHNFNKDPATFTQEDQEDLAFQLSKISQGLVSGVYSKPSQEDDSGYQAGISPRSLKTLVGKNHEEFSSMRQQDAFEFWNYLLDKVDKLDPELNDIFRFINVEKFSLGDNKVKFKSQVNENLTLSTMNELEETINEKGESIKAYKREDFLDLLLQYLTPEEIELGGKQIQKTNFFKTFPKYLVTAIQRIQLQNWIPVKTDVPLSLPDSFDIKDFQSPELLEEGEIEVKEEEAEEPYQFNTEALNNLLQMGFPENRAKKAIYETDSSDPEYLMNWLIERMEDPTIDDPVEFVSKSKKASNGPQIDEIKISSLMDMGFSYQLAKKALFVNQNNVEVSVEWLFSNPGDDGNIPEAPVTVDKSEILESLPTKDRSEYSLKAVICHKGSQVTSGHYVAFIKVNERWILFNDEKVIDITGDSGSWAEIEKNGYVYVWEQL